MPYPNKPLNEMTADEIAQLSPEQFRELAGAHNDCVEQSEQNYQRSIDIARSLTDDELHGRRRGLEIKNSVDGDFEVQGLYVAEPFNVNHERQLNAAIDEQTRRYLEQKQREDQAALDKWKTKEFLDGPDNPLNYRDVRENLQSDTRLSPEQKTILENFQEQPPTSEQQRDIFLALGKEARLGYGGTLPARTPSEIDRELLARAYPEIDRLPNPDLDEVDKLLDHLHEPEPERFGKPFIQAVVQSIKELPETIREKMNPFRPLLKYDHENDQERPRPLSPLDQRVRFKSSDRDDDNERENTLRDDRW